MVAERAQRTANRKNTCKLRKQLCQFYNTCAANAHNTTKYRNALQINFIYLVVLWAFEVCFCICWRWEHLQHFLFCVFWSYSVFSSLSHRSDMHNKHCIASGPEAWFHIFFYLFHSFVIPDYLLIASSMYSSLMNRCMFKDLSDVIEVLVYLFICKKNI